MDNTGACDVHIGKHMYSLWVSWQAVAQAVGRLVSLALQVRAVPLKGQSLGLLWAPRLVLHTLRVSPGPG